MSDYTPTTDFSIKDGLITGDPNKIIKGSDFDIEFEAIETAIVSKYDSSSLGISSGSSLVGFISDGIGAAATTVQAKLREVTSVKDFGATGDGVTDDTAAIQAAVTDAMLNGTSLYIPAGEYILSGAITGSGTKPISITGDGPALSQLIWSSTASGIQLTFDDAFTVGDCCISNVGFFADTANCVGPAISLVATTISTTSPNPGPVLFNNMIQHRKGTSATTRNWLSGIVIENFSSGLIQANFLYGTANTPTGNGITFTGNCTPGPTIRDNHFYWWDKAVTRGNGASDTIEGTYLSDNIFVANNYGVHWDCSGVSGDPDLKVLNGHISSFLGGVVAIDANQSVIDGVLFYRRAAATGDYADITITDSVIVKVSNNTFTVSGTSGTETGIDLNNVDGVVCRDNYFQGSSRAVGIDIDANCSDVSLIDNQYDDTTTPVVNALTDLTKYNLKSIVAPGYASIRLTTQTIPNASATALSWTGSSLLATTSGVFSVGDPTKLVVPKDVTKVKIACSILFDTNDTGYRQVQILKNGSAFHGYTNDRTNPLSAAATVVSSCTSVLTVAPGDAFTVEVLQSSGGDLDVVSGNSTWFAMEFVG